MQYLGRMDNQVKLRGYRIELAEIETHLLRHERVEAVVVMIREETLCAYVVYRGSDGLKEKGIELRQYLEQKVPGYMVPSYYIPLEQIPVTPNGKIDRKRLPQIPVTGLENSGEYKAPGDKIEARLVEIWSGVLKIPVEAISIKGDFFRMGGHSLKATIMTARVHRAFEVRIPLGQVFKTPTVEGLASYIKGAAREFHADIETVEKREYYP
ncbi:MAG: hypothetical protein GY757_23350, partial [bacterium]|nr:hypothetical protein [bacterium]